jgi:TatD DNase family protein
MLIDTHAHLDFPEFNADRDAVIQRALDAGVSRIISIGSSLKGSRDSIDLARCYKGVYATVGMHPHEADKVSKEDLQALRDLASQEKVVAIGEIGLDYFLPAGRQGKNYSRPQNQRPFFASLLNLAKELNLAVVIHSRDAATDTLKFLKEIKPVKAVVHCFSGDADFLRSCLEEGFFVSFTCNITYKKAQGLRDLVKAAPLERLMLETDAPFLPPEGLRGKRNEPAHVKALAEEIARIKNLASEEIARVTSENAIKFFNLQ